MKATIEIPAENAHAIASILEMTANERRTPAGNVSRSGKGDFHYKEDFRRDLQSVADQIRTAARS